MHNLQLSHNIAVLGLGSATKPSEKPCLFYGGREVSFTFRGSHLTQRLHRSLKNVVSRASAASSLHFIFHGDKIT